MRALLFILLLTLIAGCSNEAAKPSPPAQPVTVAAGTPVKLLLLCRLESGKDRVGANVPFTVAEDVVGADGRVAIPKGSLAVGSVSASRGEGAMSAALFNQPARLQVKMEKVSTPGGTDIPLAAEMGEPEAAFAFTRDNTSPPETGSDRDLETTLRDEAAKAVMEKVTAAFEEEGSVSLSLEDQKALQPLYNRPDTKQAAELISQGKLDKALDLVQKLRSTKDISTLAAGFAGGELTLALQGLAEVGKVASKASDFLKGRFKGRNIRANPGTELTAYVRSSTAVRP